MRVRLRRAGRARSGSCTTLISNRALSALSAEVNFLVDVLGEWGVSSLVSFIEGERCLVLSGSEGLVYVAREFENTAQNLSLDVRHDIRDQ
jgi:hypothetical protein